MEEKRYILKVLKRVRSALSKKDFIKIKNLSNKIIHNASITQDTNVVYTAVIIYSLSKIIEREQYKDFRNWETFYNEYHQCLSHLITALEKDDEMEFQKHIDFLTNKIENLSGQLKVYIKDVFQKAKINKASRIYEHGISIEQTAKILGISVWELAEYAGQTGIADVNLGVTMPIKQRIKLAEEIFE